MQAERELAFFEESRTRMVLVTCRPPCAPHPRLPCPPLPCTSTRCAVSRPQRGAPFAQRSLHPPQIKNCRGEKEMEELEQSKEWQELQRGLKDARSLLHAPRP